MKDLGLRRGLAWLLFGIAVEIEAVALEIVGLNEQIGSARSSGLGRAGLFAAIFGGLFVLVGGLRLAFPSRPT